MKHVKFRAWEKNLEEIIPVHDIDFDRKMINTNSAWRMFNEIVLMQFTGLYDCNGKEIYEGDIIHLKHETGYEEWDESNEAVTFEMGSFSCGIYADPSGQCDCEVVGNVFEMPDWDF
jgi:uncharacterized phage protein (TIGR01671 family)